MNKLHKMMAMGMFNASSLLQRILSTSPVACYPLDDLTGTVARDASGNGRVGTYQLSGVANSVANWTPFDYGLGTPAPFFNGAINKRVVDLLPAGNTFNNCCDWDQFSMMIYSKVSDVNVWTDATTRFPLHIGSANGSVGLNINSLASRSATNNALLTSGRFNGDASSGITLSGQSDVGWVCHLLTVDRANQEYKWYVNGVQVVGTDTVARDWDQASLNLALIGGYGTTNANWLGWLAYATFWNRVLTQPEITKVFF